MGLEHVEEVFNGAAELRIERTTISAVYFEPLSQAHLAASDTGRQRVFRDGDLLVNHVISEVVRSIKGLSVSVPSASFAPADIPVSHGANEDDNRVRVWDGRQVFTEANWLGVERQG